MILKIKLVGVERFYYERDIIEAEKISNSIDSVEWNKLLDPNKYRIDIIYTFFKYEGLYVLHNDLKGFHTRSDIFNTILIFNTDFKGPKSKRYDDTSLKIKKFNRSQSIESIIS